MNERLCTNIVYSLAKEAGLIEFEKFDWNPELGSPTYESVMKARKFAELIVKECVEACYNHKDVEGFGIYPVRVALVTKACADNIKEHFGVGE